MTYFCGSERWAFRVKRSTYSEDDSPQDFVAKIANMKQMTRKLLVRNTMALKNGVTVGGKKWKRFIADTPLFGIPDLQQRGEELANLGYSEEQVLGILSNEGYR